MASTLETFLCEKMVENTSYEVLVSCRISALFRGSVLWGTPEYLLYIKRQIILFWTSHNTRREGGKTTLSRYLCVLEEHIPYMWF